MNLSLTKNHLIISLFILSIVWLPLRARSSQYEYQIDFDARYGIHSYGAPDVATNRQAIAFEQKAEFNKQWSLQLGARAEVEAAYASLPEHYNGDVAKKDSQSFFLRDNFLQFQSGSFRGRLGYQQVVWGEAFGNYYADIVNPKDFREAGLGDLSRNRLDSPIVNLQWIFAQSSVQLLYIPVPSHSLLPSSGSDFNTFVLPATLSNYSLTINRDADHPPQTGEYGMRITQQISRLDFSLFYLNYFDRLPVYQLQISPATTSVTALPNYKPLQTAGATASLDLGGFLFRSEAFKNLNREFNTYDGTNLSSAKSDELVYVFGVDLPSIDKWQVAVQYSESRLTDNTWLGRANPQSVASLHILKMFRHDISFETILTEFTQDASALLQTHISLPLSSQIEMLIGFDKFDGSDTSTLGPLRKASRSWVMLKTTIKK